MSLIARFIGVEEVVSQYDKIGLPCFSMWCKSAIICQYNSDSMEEGAEMIREEIQRNIDRKLPQEMFLKIHPAAEKNFTLKSPVAYNICFKSFDSPEFFPGNNNANNNVSMLLLEKLNAIESRQTAIEKMMLEEEEEEETEEDTNDRLSGIIGQVNGLLDHPLMGLLIGRIMEKPQNKISLAGVEEDNQLAVDALARIMAKGLTLQHLLKLAAMPKEKLQQLLNLL